MPKDWQPFGQTSGRLSEFVRGPRVRRPPDGTWRRLLLGPGPGRARRHRRPLDEPAGAGRASADAATRHSVPGRRGRTRRCPPRWHASCSACLHARLAHPRAHHRQLGLRPLLRKSGRPPRSGVLPHHRGGGRPARPGMFPARRSGRDGGPGGPHSSSRGALTAGDQPRRIRAHREPRAGPFAESRDRSRLGNCRRHPGGNRTDHAPGSRRRPVRRGDLAER